MVRNIPNKYTQRMLLDELDIVHHGHYDFFYLPIDFKNRCNVGYAFINFIHPLSISTFCKGFQGKRWTKFNSEKVCAVTYARIQGKRSMVERFQNSSLMGRNEDCRPMIFYTKGNLRGQPEPWTGKC